MPGKIIVYCNSIREVELYSDSLRVDGYFSRADMKREKLEDFITGKQQLIVARVRVRVRKKRLGNEEWVRVRVRKKRLGNEEWTVYKPNRILKHL